MEPILPNSHTPKRLWVGPNEPAGVQLGHSVKPTKVNVLQFSHFGNLKHPELIGFGQKLVPRLYSCHSLIPVTFGGLSQADFEVSAVRPNVRF